MIHIEAELGLSKCREGYTWTLHDLFVAVFTLVGVIEHAAILVIGLHSEARAGADAPCVVVGRSEQCPRIFTCKCPCIALLIRSLPKCAKGNVELGAFAYAGLVGGEKCIGFVCLTPVGEVGVVDSAEILGRSNLLPMVIPVVSIVLAQSIGYLFGYDVSSVGTSGRYCIPADGRLGVGRLVILYDGRSNRDIKANPDGNIGRSALACSVVADDGVRSLAILNSVIFVGDGLTRFAFKGSDHLAIATYFNRSDFVESIAFEGGGRQGEGQGAVECTASTWSCLDIRRSSRSFEESINGDANVVECIVGAVFRSTVVESDVVEAVFLNAEIDDLAGIIVPPVEVVLCKRGLEGIYCGSLSEEDVQVLMSQANFVCIEGETILYVLLKLDGRSDEVVIHSLAAIGVEVWIVSTVAKEVSALIS